MPSILERENVMPAVKSSKQEINKNKYGQYFTPIKIADFMVALTDKPKQSLVLDPCCGRGAFLEALSNKGYTNLNAFEIDSNLKTNFDFVKYRSFIGAKRLPHFDLIIGNPPYIRWRNIEPQLKKELLDNKLWNEYCNSLCDYLQIFILKSIDLLKDQGELIFICPEYWMHTTHSRAMRNYMLENGYFTKLVHFNEGRIFKGVNVATVVFKYVKCSDLNFCKQQSIAINKCSSVRKVQSGYLEAMLNNDNIEYVESFSIPQFKSNEPWVMESQKLKQKLARFEERCVVKVVQDNEQTEIKHLNTLGEFCRVANGMVSGLDNAFCIPTKTTLNKKEQDSVLKIIKAREISPYKIGQTEDYYFINNCFTEQQFRNDYPNFAAYIDYNDLKDKLNSRYLMNSDTKFWEWSFPRNMKFFINADGQFKDRRIFVPCKERISNKNYFRFAIAARNYYPTQDVTAILPKAETLESIEYIVAFLNQSIVFDWLKTYGIVKGNIVEFSYKPVSSIPYLAIDWQNEEEVRIHDEITNLVHSLDTNLNKDVITQINNLFQKLLEK